MSLCLTWGKGGGDWVWFRSVSPSFPSLFLSIYPLSLSLSLFLSHYSSLSLFPHPSLYKERSPFFLSSYLSTPSSFFYGSLFTLNLFSFPHTLLSLHISLFPLLSRKQNGGALQWYRTELCMSQFREHFSGSIVARGLKLIRRVEIKKMSESVYSLLMAD